MEREFTRFVEQPSRSNYLAARDAVLRASPRLVQLCEIVEIGKMIDEGRCAEAIRRLAELPPSSALSPRVHFLAAEAAEALNDAENCELERFLFVVCIRALLATGDGSQKSPFSVCHTTDEYDLLESLGLEAVRQVLKPQGAATFDVVECTGGRKMWFDVTTAMPPRKMRRKVAAGKTRAPRRTTRVVN